MSALDWLCMFGSMGLAVLAAIALANSVDKDRGLKVRLAYVVAWVACFGGAIMTGVAWAANSARWNA